MSKRINLTNWCAPSEHSASVIVWPLNHGANGHAGLLGRITVAMDTGCASLHLRPTVAETRQLIDALQAALAGVAA